MQSEPCPISKLAHVLGRKWTLELIYNLQTPQRFCDLQTRLGGINPTTLTQRLRLLEQEGIIVRYDRGGMPPHVDYELTDRGRDLTPILDAMLAWSDRWQAAAEIADES